VDRDAVDNDTPDDDDTMDDDDATAAAAAEGNGDNDGSVDSDNNGDGIAFIGGDRISDCDSVIVVVAVVEVELGELDD
jgi:hypothetical protein